MDDLDKLAKLIRYYSLISTTNAGSGHLTSSLSATDLMTTLFFGGFLRYDTKNPDYKENDRVIFSKGHATPLYYSLWVAAGALSENDLVTKYRRFGSPLEGHPSMEFKFTEVPTGSLGQGLSVGLGMALNAKLDKLSYKTYVLLGDGEMTEGSVWEAIQLASHYKLNNLVGIIDVNRLGQTGETMLGWNVNEYKKRVSSFGWDAIVIDGHNFHEISHAFSRANSSHDKPVMIIAKTIKGKGIKKWENKNGFHAKTVPQAEIGETLKSFGEIDLNIRGKIAKPPKVKNAKSTTSREKTSRVAQGKLSYVNNNVAQFSIGDLVSTRKSYGQTLVSLAQEYPSLVVLDGEVSNSTYSNTLIDKFPDRFFEMYIAEQNMVGAGLGFARRGKLPFLSTFSAFWTRAHDQIRMVGYAKADLKFIGSHVGVSIGEDGTSQMGLEDISMFRSVFGSSVLYPSDAVSASKLTIAMAKHNGIVYLRTTRMDTPVIYEKDEEFVIGGNKVLKSSNKDKITIVGAGITLHEALKAYDLLVKEGIKARIIDLYSIKPLDSATLERAADETQAILVVEDHYPEGGIAEAVRSSLITSKTPIYSLAVEKMPRSGKPDELLSFEKINSTAILHKTIEILY